jgi:hypothetical protein
VSNGGDLLYVSPRRFQVWEWSVSHSALLLRSNPQPGHPGRVEVLFKPAYAVCLSSSFDGLEIRAGMSQESAAALVRRPLEAGEHLFEILTAGPSGWVVAGAVHGREDDLEYFSPSMFDGLTIKPGERELFGVRGA